MAIQIGIKLDEADMRLLDAYARKHGHVKRQGGTTNRAAAALAILRDGLKRKKGKQT